MKRVIIPTIVLVVAACGEAEVPVEADTVAEEVAAAGVVASPGLYAVGDATTQYAHTRLNDDGTYVDLEADGETEVGAGTWTVDGATMCFDPAGDGEDQEERCWINGTANADGSFTTTRDDNSQSYVVTPVTE